MTNPLASVILATPEQQQAAREIRRLLRMTGYRPDINAMRAQDGVSMPLPELCKVLGVQCPAGWGDEWIIGVSIDEQL